MDWTNKVPPYDSQYSATTHTDAQDCVEESLCHILYMITGVRYSPRALGYLTNVTPLGSSVDEALKAANNNGLILYDLWPTPDSFTWESYYAPIPQNILATGTSLGLELIPADLNKSPLWTEISLGFDSPGVIATKHMVAQINDTQYFDSEQGAPIKSFTTTTPILYQTSLLITKKMNQFKTQNKGGELRIVLQAATPEEWQALCKVYGVDATQIDEII